jgi:hypothetical protein
MLAAMSISTMGAITGIGGCGFIVDQPQPPNLPGRQAIEVSKYLMHALLIQFYLFNE